MTRRKWGLVVVICMLPGTAMFFLVGGLMAYFVFSQPPSSTLEARDPNSPTVVWIDRIDGIGGPAGWSCVISTDGQRQTQFAGWPTDQIAPGAEPSGVIWHGNPDWVEIILSSGERLKLTWDTKAAERARASREVHCFLNPRYEALP